MKVLFASSECAPFFKTGGLGDVAGALPKELAKKSEIDSVAVILPYFKNEMKEEYRSLLKDEFYDFVDVGWRHEYVGVKSLEKEGNVKIIGSSEKPVVIPKGTVVTADIL